MSTLAFSCFRALTHFGDLSFGGKVLRIIAFPYFIVKALFAPAPVVTTPYKSLYELPAREVMDPVTQQKSTFDFSTLKGRPVLVMNVASACGLTAQNYAELSKVYDELKAKTQLEVLAFPCDQFMHQEKGDLAGVCTFAAKKGAKWPVFDKVDVNGPNAADVFNFAKVASKDTGDVEWNFGKFLFARDGKTVKRFLPSVPPSQLVSEIEKL